MRKIFALLVLFFCLQTGLYSQNVKVVDYNFKTRTMNGLLPFDQHFVIRVSGLDGAKLVTVNIYEIKKYDYKKLARDSGDVTKLDMRKIAQRALFFTDVYDSSYIHNDSCEINVNAYLQPNSRYIIEIRTNDPKPISDAEKQHIKNKIATDPLVNKLISDEINKDIKDSKNVLGDDWVKITTLLNSRANEIIKSINSNYIINEPPDFSEQVSKISDIFVNNVNILSTLTDDVKLYNKEFRVQDSPGAIAEDNRTQEELNRFSFRLSHLNWFSLENGDDDYTALLDMHAKIMKEDLIRLDVSRDKLKRNDSIRVSQINDIIDAKENFITFFLEMKASSVKTGAAAASTYPVDFVERARQHVTFDLGYAYVWGIDRGNAYAAMHINFRGVDTSLPLKNYRAGIKDYLASHLSLLIGISVDGIQKDSVRKGIVGNNSALIIGAGYKLLPWFRINGGSYLYYKYPVNPLLGQKRWYFTGSPFISLSIDVNLSSLINSFSNGNIFKRL